MPTAEDIDGRTVTVGSRVTVLGFSGDWYENLPVDEKPKIDSMIGESFTVEEIDQYGGAWISKSWHSPERDECEGHSVSLASSEMKLCSE
jgi:hypothetical protein